MNYPPPSPYPYGQAPPPPAPRLKLRPAAGWYALAAIPALLLPVLAIALGVAGVIGAFDDIEEVGAGGTARVQLEAGEDHGVYSDFGGSGAASCEVVDPGGATVPTRRPTGSYEINGWDAIGRFEARGAGTYTLRCPPGAGAAFGPDPDITGLFGGILAVIGLVLLGPALGLVVVLVILWMRSRDKRRQLAALGFR